jgi:hypothetical protein
MCGCSFDFNLDLHECRTDGGNLGFDDFLRLLADAPVKLNGLGQPLKFTDFIEVGLSHNDSTPHRAPLGTLEAAYDKPLGVASAHLAGKKVDGEGEDAEPCRDEER